MPLFAELFDCLEVINIVKIRWIITDFIKNVSKDEFNAEWGGIFGYFEMCINNQMLGFCPNRKMLSSEEGNEDILYWLLKLSDGIIQLNNDKEYEIQLLSMNLAKIILKREDKLLVCLVNSSTDEVIWSEEIMFQEWCDEIKLNIEKFITEILRVNSVLLNTNLIQKLYKINEMINYEDSY